MGGTTDKREGAKGRWQTIVAWLGTLGLLAYLGLTTDFDQALQALRLGNLWQMAAVTVVTTFATWLSDSATVAFLLRRTGTDMRFREFAGVKAVSYLLNLLNYNLALVMMAGAVARRTARGWAAAGSPFLLLNFMDLVVLALFMLGGFALGSSPFGPELTLVLCLLATGGALAAPVLCVASRLRLPGFLARLAGHDLLSAFREVRPLDFLASLGLRAAFMTLYVIMWAGFLHSFRFEVPLADLLVFQPILSFVVFIPISIAGLGSTQVLQREFYGPFAPAGLDGVAAVDAMSTVTILSVVLLRVVLGLVFMARVTRSLKTEQGEAPR